MSGSGHNETRLTEKQVGAVLRRAAEIQESQGQAFGETGTSPADVVKIGEELGIDPSCLRRAIEEVVSGRDPATRRSIWGGPVTLATERTLPGTVSEDDWHEIVSNLRTSFARVGEVSEVAGAWEWSGVGGGLDPLHVSVRSKDGNTRVKAQSDLSGAAVLAAIVSLVPLMVSGAVIGKAMPGDWWVKALAFLAALALIAMGIRRWLGWLADRRLTSLDKVFAQVEKLASEERAQAVGTTAVETEATAPLQQRL